MVDDMHAQAPGPTDKVTLRDVYAAVGATEARIIDTLTRAIKPLADSSMDHEQRIRSLETLGSPEAREALKRITVMEGAVAPLAILSTERDRRLGAVELMAASATTDILAFKNRENGILGTLGFGKALVIMAMAVGGTALAVIDIVLRFGVK
jgi:hypothetical protein